MNREVGGFGHDPKTEPVEPHIDKNNPYCFEDQTVAAAEQTMLNAKVGEVFVVTREKLLARNNKYRSDCERENGRKNAWNLSNPAPESLAIGYSILATPPRVINKYLKQLNGVARESLTCSWPFLPAASQLL